MKNALGKIIMILTPFIAILLARSIPKGIIGVVLVSIILSFVLVGKSSLGLLFLVFTIPVILSLIITPECITSLHTRNREYYGSTFNVCKYIARYQSMIPYMRLLGECIFIGSVLFFSLRSGVTFRVVGGLIGMILIAIEMMLVHPVPLLDREYIQWKLQPNPLTPLT